MSERRAEYHAGAKTAVERVPLNLAPCPECGHALSIWKVEQINHRDLVLRMRCNACYYPALPRHLEFVPPAYLHHSRR